MSKITIQLECEDPDVAMFLIAFHTIYEGDMTTQNLQPAIADNALGYLRDKLNEWMDYWVEDGYITTLKEFKSITEYFWPEGLPELEELFRKPRHEKN